MVSTSSRDPVMTYNSGFGSRATVRTGTFLILCLSIDLRDRYPTGMLLLAAISCSHDGRRLVNVRVSALGSSFYCASERQIAHIDNQLAFHWRDTAWALSSAQSKPGMAAA
jgi:hypothetical protein